MLSLAGVAAAALPSVAPAQETGSLIKRYKPATIEENGLTGEQRAQVTMNAYAACLVERDRGDTEEFVATEPGSEQETKVGRNISDEDCLSTGELSFRASLLRGGIYEALYRTDFKQAADGVPARVRLQYAPRPVGELNPNERQYVALRQFADCATRANPDGVRAVLLSRVASHQEREAFTRINPSLGGCVTQGVKLTFSYPTLRGLLAETLYRLSKAEPQPVEVAGGAAAGGENR